MHNINLMKLIIIFLLIAGETLAKRRFLPCQTIDFTMPPGMERRVHHLHPACRSSNLMLNVCVLNGNCHYNLNECLLAKLLNKNWDPDNCYRGLCSKDKELCNDFVEPARGRCANGQCFDENGNYYKQTGPNIKYSLIAYFDYDLEFSTKKPKIINETNEAKDQLINSPNSSPL